MAWTAAEVRAALGLPPGSAGEPAFTGISTDTRRIGPGALFVALRGERFDGHDHLEAAVAAGAIGAVVRRGTPPVAGLRLYEVEDTLRALGWLGRARRRHLKGPVVAVTGTNGKTSTKELLAAALRTRFVTHATLANLNNLVGVPQTILEAPSDTEAMVIEAGASLPGEIGRYREIIEPTIAVITNVAPGHLEGFGTLEGVLAEKLALVDDVPLAVVGTEPPAREGPGAGRFITVGLEHASSPAAVAPTPARASVTVDQLTFAATAGPPAQRCSPGGYEGPAARSPGPLPAFERWSRGRGEILGDGQPS
jgi:UDP-N-acetylmuramoyl-tripeptide--D-alanyl-D-alanine ligase